MPMTKALGLLLLSLSVVLAAGCGGSTELTQVVLEVDTDIAAPATIDEIRATIRRQPKIDLGVHFPASSRAIIASSIGPGNIPFAALSSKSRKSAREAGPGKGMVNSTCSKDTGRVPDLIRGWLGRCGLT